MADQKMNGVANVFLTMWLSKAVCGLPTIIQPTTGGPVKPLEKRNYNIVSDILSYDEFDSLLNLQNKNPYEEEQRMLECKALEQCKRHAKLKESYRQNDDYLNYVRFCEKQFNLCTDPMDYIIYNVLEKYKLDDFEEIKLS